MKTAQGKIPMDPDISALAEEGRAIVRHEIKTQEASDDIASRVQESPGVLLLPQKLPDD